MSGEKQKVTSEADAKETAPASEQEPEGGAASANSTGVADDDPLSAHPT